MKSPSLIDQHIHGGYGVNFNTASIEEVLFVSQKLFTHGIGYYFPTLATDTLQTLKRQISVIKEAKKIQSDVMSQIVGVHLEGPFLSPDKKGIHPESLLVPPTVDNFKQIEDDIIKIVTLAPELDDNQELALYLKLKNIKVSAGHTEAFNLQHCNQVTHLFNAMSGIHHRKKSTVLSAFLQDEIYTEIICDGEHVIPDMLKFLFKFKSLNKILMISDSLPLAYKEGLSIEFCNEIVKLVNNKAVNDEGTLAGSALWLNDMVKYLVINKLVSFEKAIQIASLNQSAYHSIQNKYQIEWDENINIRDIKKV